MIRKFQQGKQLELPESLKKAKNTFATQQQINEANKTYQARINAGQVQRQNGSWMTKEQHQRAIKDFRTPKKGNIDVDYSDPLTLGITALAAPSQGLLKAATTKLSPKLNTVGKITREFFEIIDPTSIGVLSKQNIKKVEKGEDFLKRWYESPEIQKRITNYNVKDGTKSGNKSTTKRNITQKVYDDYILLSEDIRPEMKGYNGIYNTSTSPRISINRNAPHIESTKVHEGTHAITRGDLGLGKKENEDLRKPFDFSIYESKNYEYEKPNKEYIKYLSEPTEIHARMNQIRHSLEMRPDEKFTPLHLKKFNEINDLEDVPIIDPYFLDAIKSPEEFSDLMNKMYGVVPAAIGTGLGIKASTNDNKSLRIGGKFKKGGLFKFIK